MRSLPCVLLIKYIELAAHFLVVSNDSAGSLLDGNSDMFAVLHTM